MTTVGFGDIAPKTDLDRLIASFMMLLGWGALAVPTGIATAVMATQRRMATSPVVETPQARAMRTCPDCMSDGQSLDANFCFHCGARLPSIPEPGDALAPRDVR